MKKIDIHTHLLNKDYDLEKEINDVLKENELVINVGSDYLTSKEVVEINKKNPKILSCVGIHPCDSNEEIIDDLKKIETLIKDNIKNISCYGEIGLDYYHTHNKDIQIKNFILQISLASKYGLPIMIHTRESIDDVFDIVKNYPEQKFLIHSWTGDDKQAKKFLTLKNLWFSFNGMITFSKENNQKNTLKLFPIEKIFFETDAPFLTPAPFRGKKNHSYYVKYVYKKASEILNISEEKLIDQVKNNLKGFLNE